MTTKQPEALPALIERFRGLHFDHAPDGWPAVRTREITALLDRITELEAQLSAIGAGGVSGPLIGQPQAMPDLSQLTERGAKAWAGVDAQGLREGFTAADMATASAQGFRDGVASVSAGSAPVATVFTMEALTPGGGVKYHATIHKPLPAGTKLYAAPHPALSAGWQPIETAPKDGTRILLHPAVEVRDAWSKGHWSEQQGCWLVGGSAPGVAHTYWLPLPPAPPTTSAAPGPADGESYV